MRSHLEVARLLAAEQGVILRREHPELTDAVKRMTASGRLVSILPGAYVPAGTEGDPMVRIRAMARWAPDAVFTGSAAARLSYWPEVRLDKIHVAVRHARQPQRGFVFTRRLIPSELVVDQRGLRLSNPSLSALDLSDLEHSDAIDTALRTRAATLATLHEAFRLTPGRRGNRARRQVLIDSRDAPWSRAERCGHRLLRAAHITGWKTNVPFVDLTGLYYLDIAFDRVKLAIEIDGRFHEDDPQVFEADRWRQNALVMRGWRVLRFTWSMLQDHPEQFIRTIRRAL